MALFNFEFDELPLVIAEGVAAGQISGQAEIIYTGEGSWAVADVTLDGPSKRINGKLHFAQVAAPAPVAAIIRNRLLNEWLDLVQSAVNSQIEADYESAADNRADARRSLELV